MAEMDGAYKIKQLQRAWITCLVVADVVFAAAIALVLVSVLKYFFNWPLWTLPIVFIVSWAIIATIKQPWRLTLNAVCSFLNGTYTELEESTELAIKPVDTLNILEVLQRNKIADALQAIPTLPWQLTRRVVRAGVAIIIAAGLSAFILNLHRTGKVNGTNPFASTNTVPEKVLPQVESVAIKINPPAYTGLPGYTQDKFTINAPEGAEANWTVTTNTAVKNAYLLFNEKEKITLASADADKTKWKAAKNITQPGFYQVYIDGKVSDLYAMQVIKDQLPVIRVKTPQPYTHIDAGEAPRVNLAVNLSDDYGIAGAQIVATVAKGSGEAVKFKEYKMDFGASFQAHNRQYALKKLIDLPSLNMQPGDELYFYIEAQDNHQQKSRTDVYIVSIQDTAQLLSMDGILTSSAIKPEFFRSERQIIIDSQQLLKDKDSLSVEVFNKHCNDLGLDQKLLRLRYGKFLGEEDESGKEGNDELAKVENFSNAQMFTDAYTDRHDNAEDAGFLEPAVKEQLKATLSEMWKAELQLRMYKPGDALPFEYKALRLLKDLQQKSRAYVAKTSYNPPPIKMEKRLSGDLSKIIQPINKQDIKIAADRFEALKKAIIVLEQLKYQHNITTDDKTRLAIAEQQLSNEAPAEPGIYLPALSALHRMLTAGKAQTTDIAVIERAIQKTLPQKGLLPAAIQATADKSLAQDYYKNLNHTNR